MKLNIESKKEQLKRAVLEDVRTGRYKPGERLPSEREFTERFPISRITVKAALNELETMGVLRTPPQMVQSRGIRHLLQPFEGLPRPVSPGQNILSRLFQEGGLRT